MSTATKSIARACFAVMVLCFVAGIGWTILLSPAKWNGLSDHVSAKLDESGVRNPVTAVLLNFRGYDTLLEIGVLLVAALGVRALVTDRVADNRVLFEPAGPVLTGLLRLIAPLIVVVAGYLLWIGGHAPGGAFQAGAVLASFGVLMVLCNPRLLPRVTDGLERLFLSVALFVFVGVGLAVMLVGGSLLQYPAHQAKWLILLIESACTLSIATALVALFAGGRVASADHVETDGQMENRP